jgi:hypothetical protein
VSEGAGSSLTQQQQGGRTAAVAKAKAAEIVYEDLE